MLERKGRTGVRQTKQVTILHGALSIQPKLSKIWKKRQWYRNFRKSFRKFLKLLNFRNANHSTENSGNSGSKVEWKGNFRENIFENLGIPREVLLFFGNFGKCCSIRYWKLPKISNRTFSLNGKRPRCTCTHGCFVQ